MPPADEVETSGKVAPRSALNEIAEELGRLAARRLHPHRRGYGLVEGLAGMLVMAGIVLFLYWLAL